MKNRILVMLIVLALSAVSLGIVSADQGQTQLKAVTLGPVSLLASPAEGAEVALELPAYTTVDVVMTDETGGWLEVSTADGSGYAPASNFLVLNLPALAPEVYVATRTAGSAGVFAIPDITADLVGTPTNGAVATLLGVSGQWYYVMLSDGTVGWSIDSGWKPLAEGAYQALVTARRTDQVGVFAEAIAGSEVVAVLPVNSVVYVLGTEGEWAQVLTADGTQGYMISDGLVALPNTFVEVQVGSGRQAGLFVEPNFDAEVLASLSNGVVATFVESVDDYWFKLYHPSYGVAYGLKDHWGKVYTLGTVEIQDAVVRAGPNDNVYNAVAVLDAGTTVIIKGTNKAGGWYQVAIPFDAVDYPYYGVSGWMRDFLFVDQVTGEVDFDPSLLKVTE